MAAHNYVGFISMRGSAEGFAKALKDRLKDRYDIDANYQEDLGKVGDLDHREYAEKLIRESDFFVALMTPERLTPENPDVGRPEGEDVERCGQDYELEYGFETNRGRHGTKRTHKLIFVDMFERGAENPKSDLAAFLGTLDYGSSRVTNIETAPICVEDDPEKWESTLNKVCASIADHSAKPHPQGTTHTGSLTDVELSYLRERVPDWQKGHLDHVPRVPDESPEGVLRRRLFEFDADRCLELRATSILSEGQTNKKEKGDKRSLIDWIFDDDINLLLVRGPAGAGKSTALTTSAAFMASRIAREFRAETKDLAGTNVFTKVRSTQTRHYFPIVVSCAAVASNFDVSDSVVDHYKSFQNLILNRLGNPEPNAEDREALQARMAEQPMAFFFDALDEVIESTRAEQVGRLTKYIADRAPDLGLKVKVILSARMETRIKSDLDQVVIRDLSVPQIHGYIESYAEAIPQSFETQRVEFTEKAKDFFRNHDQILEVLSQPFNLNSFCWLVFNEKAPNTETALFKEIVDGLVKAASLSCPAGFENFHQEPKDQLPFFMLKILLRRLAYDAQSSTQPGMLAMEDAERLCEHTLNTIYEYQIETEGELIPQDYPKKILREIAEKTELCYISDDNQFTFLRNRFFEYLAGERIDSDALTTTSLIALEPKKIDVFEKSINFCYSLRLSRGSIEYANNVLEGLRRRVETEEDAQQAFKWLGVALKCFNEGIEADSKDSAHSGQPNRNGYRLVSDTAVQLWKKHGNALPPRGRADFLNEFYRIGRSADFHSALEDVEKLIESIAGKGDRWRTIPPPQNTDDEDYLLVKNLKVERTPVIVCEFDAFLKATNAGPDIWDHAPEDQRKLINEVMDLTSPLHDTSPLESWRVQRRFPGNPVTFVNWYEAVAYARWQQDFARTSLEEGEIIRLPTRAEADAIGKVLGDGADYPWGDQVGHDEEATVNWHGAGVRSASPPGTFKPIEGIVDYGSNVWIWTIAEDAEGRPIWPPTDNVAKQEHMRVTGVSWADTENELNSNRAKEVFERDLRLGIRLVVDREENLSTKYGSE